MNVLGIESSCDETSVAVLSDGELKANLISSQLFHKNYGGVVPELSSRAHLQIVTPLVKKALEDSQITLKDIDLVAATAGPGLIGALLVGLTYGKSLAYSLNKPFVPVNHIEGHIYSPFLMPDKPELPYLCVVVSGGHTLLLIVKSETEIIKLGTTIDDAAGEAFDKVSKMLGLGYPGGPKIQEAAEKGDKKKILFPVAQTKNPYDFSFSGLKTSVLRHLQNNYGTDYEVPENDIPDIAASFQHAVVRAIGNRVKKVLKEYSVNTISLAGGVAANKAIRNEIAKIAIGKGLKVVIPDMEYCGDNAAMIALRGKMVHDSGKRFNFNFTAYPSISENIFI